MKVDTKKTNLFKVVLCTAIGFYAAQLMAFTPTEIAGLELWLDAADSSTITTTSVGRVSQWSDKSGKDKHATQATDGSRPMYVSSVTNGLPGIHFDSMFLNTACVPATGANPRTLIAVVANIGQNGINYEHVLHYGASQGNQAFGICSRVSGTYVWGNHYWGLGAGSTRGSVP